MTAGDPLLCPFAGDAFPEGKRGDSCDLTSGKTTGVGSGTVTVSDARREEIDGEHTRDGDEIVSLAFAFDISKVLSAPVVNRELA